MEPLAVFAIIGFILVVVGGVAAYGTIRDNFFPDAATRDARAREPCSKVAPSAFNLVSIASSEVKSRPRESANTVAEIPANSIVRFVGKMGDFIYEWEVSEDKWSQVCWMEDGYRSTGYVRNSALRKIQNINSPTLRPSYLREGYVLRSEDMVNRTGDRLY